MIFGCGLANEPTFANAISICKFRTMFRHCPEMIGFCDCTLSLKASGGRFESMIGSQSPGLDTSESPNLATRILLGVPFPSIPTPPKI